MVLESVLISFFYSQLFSVPSTTNGINCLFSIMYSCLFCHILGNNRCVDLSLFHPVSSSFHPVSQTQSQNSGCFYTKRGEGMAHCCKLCTGILCSCICSCGAVHNVPVNLQQDKCYSLFFKFLSLYERKNVILLKVRALRMGYHIYISGYRQHSFTKMQSQND